MAWASRWVVVSTSSLVDGPRDQRVSRSLSELQKPQVLTGVAASGIELRHRTLDQGVAPVRRPTPGS
jgi:hypothetical protein